MTFAGGCSDTDTHKENSPPPETSVSEEKRVDALPTEKKISPKEAVSEESRIGVYLKGERASSALLAIHDYSANDTTTPDEIGVRPSGQAFDRTNLSVSIVLLASVGEVNDLLASIDGRIVDMLDGTAILLVKIPDPGDLPSLDKIAAQVEASPIVRRVTLADMGAPDYVD